MRWLKRDRWKTGIVFAGMLFVLVLAVWLPASAASAYEVPSGLAGPIVVTVQATPTEDATITALNREKLKEDVAQQQHTWGNWLWSNATTVLSGFLSTLVVVIGLLVGFRQWSVNRDDTRTKELKAQAEERFKTAVTALGDEKEGTQVGGAILLRSFLNKDDKKSYARYYPQVFDLAVAFLRLPRTSIPPDNQGGTPHPPVDPNAPLPLTTLSQALIVIFKEAFPLARERRKKPQTLESSFLQKIKVWLKRVQIEQRFDPRSLDATGIQLDNAYLVEADLTEVWMPQAYLREANLSDAHLNDANLSNAHLNDANLNNAHLNNAHLNNAHLNNAHLHGADLSEADLHGANLSNAHLSNAHLYRANLSEADLHGANLSNAHLNNANLSNANLSEAHLHGANLSNADLSNANLKGAIIITKELEKIAKSLKGTIMSNGTKHP
jgi:uncharacterized protein YjbI with pentapeptide repeats